MSEYSVTMSLPSLPVQHEEWDSHGFWDRICYGFQGSLRRMWSEEQSPVFHKGVATANVPTKVSKQIAAETQPVSVAAPETTSLEYAWTLVLSDTDNDFQSVLRILHLTGLCDEHGCWTPGIRNFQVIHTGDWLNKWAPNPYVLDGFKRLQETTPAGCKLTLLNGNHELSVLQMADQGLRTPLTADDLAFIRQQNLIHIDHGVLYVHGYPSLDLLMILKQFQREEIAMEYCNQRLHDLYFRGRYPLFREARSMQIIGDIKNPKQYFNQRSQKGILRGHYTSSILQELGLEVVIHGHKPNPEIQLDHELHEEIPGIRLINNDNRIRKNGFGGMLMSQQGYTVFLNPQELRDAGSEKVLRKKIRKLLRTRDKDLSCKESRVNIKKKEGKAREIKVAA